MYIFEGRRCGITHCEYIFTKNNYSLLFPSAGGSFISLVLCPNNANRSASWILHYLRTLWLRFCTVCSRYTLFDSRSEYQLPYLRVVFVSPSGPISEQYIKLLTNLTFRIISNLIIQYWGRKEMYTGFLWGNQKARDHVEDLDIDGRINLIRILKE